MKPASRVLIVDDEEAIRTFAQRVLHRAGYEIAVAGGGPEALKIAETQTFDLLLADVVMPGMHGNELARRMLRHDPDLKVLYFTGYHDQLFAETATLGANEAFIDKPVSTQGLVEAVALMLSGHTRRLEPETLAGLARLRSLRVSTTALPVRIGESAGRLVNVSATGALVQLPESLTFDQEWTLQIQMESEPVELRVRVVRSHPVSVSLPFDSWVQQKYAVALTFIELDPKQEAAVKQLCADAFDKRE